MIQYTPSISDRHILMLQLRPCELLSPEIRPPNKTLLVPISFLNLQSTTNITYQSVMKLGCTRLCWLCLKYTPFATTRGPWHSTTQVNTLGGNALPAATLRKPLRRVWAHARCIRHFNHGGAVNGRILAFTCLRRWEGLAGGLDNFSSARTLTPGATSMGPRWWVHEAVDC